jgi:hypothetical protein
MVLPIPLRLPDMEKAAKREIKMETIIHTC